MPRGRDGSSSSHGMGTSYYLIIIAGNVRTRQCTVAAEVEGVDDES